MFARCQAYLLSASRYFRKCFLTLKDSRKRGPHLPSRKKPQDRNGDSQRQTRRRHENVKAQYVDNHGPQNRQCQRHVAIRKQQDRGYYLQQKNHHVKPGHEKAPKNCAATPVGGGMGIKLRNPLSPNVKKMKPSKYREIVEATFMLISW
jgi:hypothetical protein